MANLELRKEYLLTIQEAIDKLDEYYLQKELEDLFPADIATILYEVDGEKAHYLLQLVDTDLGADILSNIDSDDRKKFIREQFTVEEQEQTSIKVKYERYIEKELQLVDKMKKLENLLINPSFDYESLTSLSIEARHKLKKIKPTTLGQASRISGVSPADLSILTVYLGR